MPKAKVRVAIFDYEDDCHYDVIINRGELKRLSEDDEIPIVEVTPETLKKWKATLRAYAALQTKLNTLSHAYWRKLNEDIAARENNVRDDTDEEDDFDEDDDE